MRNWFVILMLVGCLASLLLRAVVEEILARVNRQIITRSSCLPRSKDQLNDDVKQQSPSMRTSLRRPLKGLLRYLIDRSS